MRGQVPGAEVRQLVRGNSFHGFLWHRRGTILPVTSKLLRPRLLQQWLRSDFASTWEYRCRYLRPHPLNNHLRRDQQFWRTPIHHLLIANENEVVPPRHGSFPVGNKSFWDSWDEYTQATRGCQAGGGHRHPSCRIWWVTTTSRWKTLALVPLLGSWGLCCPTETHVWSCLNECIYIYIYRSIDR